MSARHTGQPQPHQQGTAAAGEKLRGSCVKAGRHPPEVVHLVVHHQLQLPHDFTACTAMSGGEPKGAMLSGAGHGCCPPSALGCLAAPTHEEPSPHHQALHHRRMQAVHAEQHGATRRAPTSVHHLPQNFGGHDQARGVGVDGHVAWKNKGEQGRGGQDLGSHDRAGGLGTSPVEAEGGMLGMLGVWRCWRRCRCCRRRRLPAAAGCLQRQNAATAAAAPPPPPPPPPAVPSWPPCHQPQRLAPHLSSAPRLQTAPAALGTFDSRVPTQHYSGQAGGWVGGCRRAACAAQEGIVRACFAAWVSSGGAHASASSGSATALPSSPPTLLQSSSRPHQPTLRGEVYTTLAPSRSAIANAYSATTVLPADVCAATCIGRWERRRSGGVGGRGGPRRSRRCWGQRGVRGASRTRSLPLLLLHCGAHRRTVRTCNALVEVPPSGPLLCHE